MKHISFLLNNNLLRFLIILVFILLTSNVLILALTPYNIATTPDSISYLDAAQHFRAGDGMVLTNYVYEDERHFIPFTVWPPLYPAFLSLFPSIDSNPLFAAVQGSILTLFLNCLLIFFILRRVTGDALGVVALFVFMFSSANLIISSYAWSEPLFITMLLLSIFFGANSIRAAQIDDKSSLLINLTFLAVSLAGIFYTRYIGLIFGFIIPLTWWFSNKRKHYFFHHLMSLILYGFLVGLLLLRNHSLGDVTGGDVHDKARQASTLSLYDNGFSVLDSLYLLIPNNLILLAFVFVICGGLMWILKLKLNTNAQNDDVLKSIQSERKYLFWSFVLSITIYLGGLIVLRSITNFEDIRIRYIAVISPLLIMLIVVIIAQNKHYFKSSWFSTGIISISFAFLILILLQGGNLFIITKANWQKFGEPRMPLTATQNRMFYNNMTAPIQIARIDRLVKPLNATDSDIIITENPKPFAFITGLNFKRLKGGFSKESFNSLLDKHESGFLLLMHTNSKNEWQVFSNSSDDLSKSSTLVIPLPLQGK